MSGRAGLRGGPSSAPGQSWGGGLVVWTIDPDSLRPLLEWMGIWDS